MTRPETRGGDVARPRHPRHPGPGWIRAAALCLGCGFLVAAGAAADTYGILVSGLGGDEALSDDFHETSLLLYESAIASGLREENLTWLGEDPDRDRRIAERSTREAVLSALSDVGGGLGSGDVLWLVVIGHGSHRGQRTTVNLPGPDLSDQDLAAALAAVPEGANVVFVNTTSASGGFLEAVSGPGRVVVTATRSASQRNGTVFGTYFGSAFAERAADADQDGFVSALEAFRYASSEVTRHYEERNLLMTENPLLDDNGDGEGSLEPDALGGEGGGGDGPLAARLVLGASALAGTARTEENADLLDRKAELQRTLDDLRRQKSSLDEDLYLAELQRILVEMARIDRDLRRMAGEGGATSEGGPEGAV